MDENDKKIRKMSRNLVVLVEWYINNSDFRTHEIQT